MWWFRKLMLVWPAARRRRERALEEELRSHLEMAEAEARGSGMSLEEARATAQRDLGGWLRTQEQVRGEWLSPGLEQIEQDLRYAVRTLGRARLFTTVAILSLALGIGAATAVFSLVEGVLLKPLAYRDSGQLTYIQEWSPHWSACTRGCRSTSSTSFSGATMRGHLTQWPHCARTGLH